MSESERRSISHEIRIGIIGLAVTILITVLTATWRISSQLTQLTAEVGHVSTAVEKLETRTQQIEERLRAVERRP